MSRTGEKWICHYEECSEAFQARERSVGEMNEVECVHTSAAKAHGTSKVGFTYLSFDILETIPFPPDVLANFKKYAESGDLSKFVYRVSEHNFVIREEAADLGALHVRIDKKKHFFCTCSKFKRMTSLCGATTAPKVSKRCFHIYLCLWAVFSDPTLQPRIYTVPFG